jgi:trypsin-like peptidase
MYRLQRTPWWVLLFFAAGAVLPYGITADAGAPEYVRVTPSEGMRLARVAQQCERGVFLIGEGRGYGGTTFVISRRHRLLVTCAHCVDPEQARGPKTVMNALGETFRITQTWLHPDIVRLRPERSDEKDSVLPGRISSASADLAILQLEEGASLPVEFSLARTARGPSVPGRPAACLGFPLYVHHMFPRTPYRVRPATAYGIVLHTFPLWPAGLPKDAHPVWQFDATPAAWPGSSGSPLILDDGYVIGICTSGGITRNHDGSYEFRTCGVLVDHVWDLLARSRGLQGCLTRDRDGRELPPVARRTAPAPSATELTRMSRARMLREQQQYGDAADLLNALVETTAWRAEPHAERAAVFAGYHDRLHERRDPVTPETCVKYARWQYEDAVAALHLDGTNPDHHVNVGSALCVLARATGDRPCARTVQRVCGEFRAMGGPRPLQATLYALEARACRELGQLADALQAINTAIELDTSQPSFYRTRAAIRADTNRRTLAATDR